MNTHQKATIEARKKYRIERAEATFIAWLTTHGLQGSEGKFRACISWPGGHLELKALRGMTLNKHHYLEARVLDLELGDDQAQELREAVEELWLLPEDSPLLG